MGGGLARRAFGHVQLGQHHHVDIAERPQRVCVLQRHDRVGGLADLAEELSEHVVRAPRHGLRLDDFLESARRPLLVSALDGLSGQHEQPVLGPQRRRVRTDRGDVELEREDPRGVGRGGIARAQQRRVYFFFEPAQERAVGGLVRCLRLVESRFGGHP